MGGAQDLYQKVGVGSYQFDLRSKISQLLRTFVRSEFFYCYLCILWYNRCYCVLIKITKKSECPNQCTRRCSRTQYHKPCMFFCQKCCRKCLCVPPGFYGNKAVCPCYNNWKTQQGGPKCPWSNHSMLCYCSSCWWLFNFIITTIFLISHNYICTPLTRIIYGHVFGFMLVPEKKRLLFFSHDYLV